MYTHILSITTTYLTCSLFYICIKVLSCYSLSHTSYLELTNRISILVCIVNKSSNDARIFPVWGCQNLICIMF